MAISTKQGRLMAAIAFSLIFAAGIYAADSYGESAFIRDAIDRNDHELEPAGHAGGASFDRDAMTDGAYSSGLLPL